MSRTWRKVIGYERRASSDGYALGLTLECGHQIGRKASQGTPRKVHCRECAEHPPALAYNCPSDCEWLMDSGGTFDNPQMGGCAKEDALVALSADVLTFEMDDANLPMCPEYRAHNPQYRRDRE